MDTVAVPYVNLTAQHAPIKDELLAAVARVLGHGRFILGPEVEEFETRFAEYCGTRYAVGVDNGTSALYLTLRSLDVGPGDEVITAPNSFLASTAAIALTGARPVFVDVRDDFNIDPDLVQAAVTPKTRAIMPIHLTGRPADMHRIMEVADKHGLAVIEDCAQAVGARHHDQPVGSFGVAGCFSLHPLKNLSAVGDGGVITTDDPDLHDKLRMARNHGLRTREHCEFWSHNCRLDTVQAAMLLVKMKYLDGWTEDRRARAVFYRDRLQTLVQVPVDKPHEYAVYHTFVIMANDRDGLQHSLAQRGVETKVHYPLAIHQQHAAQQSGWRGVSCPVTEAQVQTILSLPIYPELTEAQSQHVVDSIAQCRGATD